MSALPQPVQEEFTQAYTEPAGFAAACLGLDLYDWQARAVQPLKLARGPHARLINIVVVAPNGSGKDDRIIPAATFWWLFRNPRGKVAITSKSDLQLQTQTIPSLDRHWPKFGYKEPTRSPRYSLRTGTGGTLSAFVSNSSDRVEGWHKEDDIEGPLLQIVNEAKSVDEDIFQGLDRWTVNARLWVSSPGLMMGRLFDVCTKHREDWIVIHAGLADCPHIPQERIDYVKRTYGENHPITRSTLYGEFMEQDDATQFCVPLSALVACLESPPRPQSGFRYAFCDFADGRAENVIVLRNGNKYTIEDGWRETNEDAVVGKFIHHFRRLNLKPEEIGGDAAAKGILDKLAQAGWAINRQPFGVPKGWAAGGGITYKSWSAMAWIEGGNKIKNREVIIPDDDLLIRQITRRKKLFTNSGHMAVEDKLSLAERNEPSPDRGDALFGAMAAIDMEALNPKAPFRYNDWKEQLENEPKYSVLDSIGAGY